MADEDLVPLDLANQAKKTLDIYTEKGLTIAAAESCTGGLVAAALTSISGCSHVFKAGYITYSNQSKTDMLDVPADLIKRVGAVSPEVAEAMAASARKLAKASAAVSVTGIAGPDGGSAEKPVGLVYIGLSTGKHTEVRKFQFQGDRSEIRRQSALKVLAWLYAAGKEL
jgi:PncC family amidohydrolase